jgi:hypothetical protein
MATMETYDKILNWKLKRGSHKFPGPDGGTCINEAAVVAAGFPYRPVRSVEDMPDCFSRPICTLALQLNDEASDDERQHLLPFVTRLACRDTVATELAREAYIAARIGYRLPFRQGLEILEGALAIGRQAEVLGPEEVTTRLEAVQQSAAARPRAGSSSPLTKIKAWFAPAD